MKKILIATLLITAGMCGAMAQKTAASGASQQSNAVKCTNAECGNADCGKQCPKDMCPFEGLDLTADQQAKLKALRTQNAADYKKGDKVKGRNGDRRQVRAEARKAKRTEMLAKIKDILTPEQYVKFLENSYVSGGDTHQNKFPGRYDRSPQPGRR